jgi:predicted  nucleic acid-binding Zn-ribbon protein
MNRLHLLSPVRCLACGIVYPKPSSLRTAESNPGCPRCGYVGWVPAEQDEDGEVIEGSGLSRSFADLPLRRFWQAG